MDALEPHRQLADADFILQFTECRLPPEHFTHEAHLRLAWVHLTQVGLQRAITRVRADLRRYTRHVGAEAKYHDTLTTAAVHAVDHFQRQRPMGDFASFIEAHPALMTNFKGLLATHYDPELLATAEARANYVAPDRQPFN
ncbi:MAG: hypothetical protein RBT71_08485 [Flavobacteriales bacterium]|jgi:hypothetical protein|nr:hypothetical protein [Flavobacteriales bacterium]